MITTDLSSGDKKKLSNKFPRFSQRNTTTPDRRYFRCLFLPPSLLSLLPAVEHGFRVFQTTESECRRHWSRAALNTPSRLCRLHKIITAGYRWPSLSKLSRSFPVTTSRRYLCNSIKHSSGPSCVSGWICHDNGRLLLNVSSFCEFINHRVTPMFCYPSDEYKIFPRLEITCFLLFYLLCFTSIAKLYCATLRYFFL